jgi:hypothetical protein
MRIGRSVALVFASYVVLYGSVSAQSDCEAGVRNRLAEALQVKPGDLAYVTRDYSTGLFPAATFYRAESGGEFHSKERTAALVVVKGDSFVVRGPDDLAPVWRRVFSGKLPRPSIASAAIRELLFQVGLLQRGDNVIRSQADLSSSYRAFLAPGSDLSAIHAPEEHTTGNGIKMTFFVQTSGGVVHYTAFASRGGDLEVSSAVVARMQMS